MSDQERIFSTADAAKVLGITTEGVRFLERQGKLRAAMRTVSGQRLFLKVDVERLRNEREARRDAAVQHARGDAA